MEKITPEDMEFGIRLEDLIKSRNMTDREVADVIGVSAPAMHHYVYGMRSPKIGTIAKLIEALEMTTSEVMYLIGAYLSNDDA